MDEKQNINFRLGTEEDSGLVTQLIYELAEYERLLDQVTTNEEKVRKSLANNEFEVLLATLDATATQMISSA